MLQLIQFVTDFACIHHGALQEHQILSLRQTKTAVAIFQIKYFIRFLTSFFAIRKLPLDQILSSNAVCL